MARLFGFDYKSPYFYMVTLKRIKGHRATSEGSTEGQAMLERSVKPSRGSEAAQAEILTPIDVASLTLSPIWICFATNQSFHVDNDLIFNRRRLSPDLLGLVSRGLGQRPSYKLDETAA